MFPTLWWVAELYILKARVLEELKGDNNDSKSFSVFKAVNIGY